MQSMNIRVPQPQFHEDYITGLKNMAKLHKAMNSMEHFFAVSK